MRGDGKAFCICYQKSFEFQKDSTPANQRTVVTYRTLLSYEPNYEPNLKKLKLGQAFAMVRIHVTKGEASTRGRRPNPGRPDVGGKDGSPRFNSPGHGQNQTPLVDGARNDHGRLAMVMAELGAADPQASATMQNYSVCT